MIEAYCDGACRGGNPGFTSCAWIVLRPGQPPEKCGYYLGPELHTNNYAEYMGLITLLEHLYRQNYRNVTIYSDSELVVNQVNQNWVINNEELRRMVAKAYGLVIAGGHILKHVKGHAGNKGNEAVDLLCNDVLDLHMKETQ